ncbi:class I SAM-dependent methyltransferase [Microbulbifer rhizosphaerae]|uniref:SAM-dependent methyltransferase n=1 Tax=Microbulbifer rhizosphaerae TaxID=1562603 RepID=A0A7W4Z9Y8_9GAMM|nr:class I SAM-dependent methyltransferase [Microbulbifer rhizosphaerae]MBB3060764.1 SAM-dependent methyltransferase [Microbulbifer rhizosphaerae]
MSTHCPLCRQTAAQPYHCDQFRSYRQCANCALVFVCPEYHLNPAEERAFYDLHENSLQDSGYRRFLDRCAQPLLAELPPASEGLDFGCGPAPLLAQILREGGHRVHSYDIFYAPDPQVFAREYDFIAATEVVEHLVDPRGELERLWARLRPGGLLSLMTKLVISRERFASWHYIRDPTHICFFSWETFRWLAQLLDAELEFVDQDVIFLRKNN